MGSFPETQIYPILKGKSPFFRLTRVPQKRLRFSSLKSCSRRHSTTPGFRENVVVAEPSRQMVETLSFCYREERA